MKPELLWKVVITVPHPTLPSVTLSGTVWSAEDDGALQAIRELAKRFDIDVRTLTHASAESGGTCRTITEAPRAV